MRRLLFERRFLLTATLALMVSDAAVLCVSADEDAAVLAAPYLRLLEESGVPTFVFLNRVDIFL